MTAKLRSAIAALALLGTTTLAWAAPEIGKPAPGFTLTDHNGKEVNLSDFSGKVVVLEWFNDQCPFVKKHYNTGAMNAVAAKYAEKGVVWLAINSSNFGTVEKNAAVASKWKISRPILDDHSGKVGKEYAATNTPQMFIVDAKGTLVYKGAIDSVDSADPDDISGATNYVAKALDEVTAGKPVTQSETKPYGCTVKY